jgi:hypothetical protein
MQTLSSAPTPATASSTPIKRNALTRLFNPGPDFSIIKKSSSNRLAIEQYIAAKFLKDHNAHIHSFMPHLLTMSCANTFSGSVGIRAAKDNPLFIENYLEKTIENYISDISGNAENRTGIVEIGNLVATQIGASQLIFILLTAVLYNANYQWVAFTATKQVEHILNKLHFKCHILTKADPKKLGDDIAQWGSYYDTNPHVIAINIADALEKIQTSKLANSAYLIYKDIAKELAPELESNNIIMTSAF